MSRRKNIYNIYNRYNKYSYTNTDTDTITLLDYREVTPPRTFPEFRQHLKTQCHDKWKKYDICGSPMVLNDQEYNYITSKSCKKRLCPTCASKRGRKMSHLSKLYLDSVKGDQLRKYMRFLTLTYKNVPNLALFEKKQISKDLTSFHKKLARFGYEVFAGFRTLEITHSDKGFHVHMHMLYFADLKDTEEHRKTWALFRRNNNLGPMSYDTAFYPPHQKQSYGYIYNQAVSDIWRYSNHTGSYITKMVPVDSFNLDGAVDYLTQYVTKTIDHNNEIDVFIQMDDFFNNIRIYQKFGKNFNELKFSNYRTFIYGKSGYLLERGIAWDYKDVFKWEDAREFLLFKTMYFRFGYNKDLTLEENNILNAVPI